MSRLDPLREWARQVVGPDCRVVVELLDDIPVPRSGKLEGFISHVALPARPE